MWFTYMILKTLQNKNTWELWRRLKYSSFERPGQGLIINSFAPSHRSVKGFLKNKPASQ